VEEESSEKLGGRFALRASGAFCGGLALGVSFGLALPLGLPRGRFAGASLRLVSDLEEGPTALAAKLVVMVVRLLLSTVQVLRLCLLARGLPPFIN
jgi:hypothetical protein